MQLAAGARLEWLPLETIAYNGCDAVNRLEFDLADGAQLLAWDVTALGLSLAGQPFEHGSFTQHLQWPGRFLEHGVIAAQDCLLLDGDLGLAGQRCLASLVFASGSPQQRAQRGAAGSHPRVAAIRAGSCHRRGDGAERAYAGAARAGAGGGACNGVLEKRLGTMAWADPTGCDAPYLVHVTKVLLQPANAIGGVNALCN